MKTKMIGQLCFRVNTIDFINGYFSAKTEYPIDAVLTMHWKRDADSEPPEIGSLVEASFYFSDIK